MSDADQSVKQIAGIEVFAYFAALNAAFDQIAKCLLHQSVGIFKHFLVISEQRVQGRRDDLFCSDGVNEQQQPRPQRFDRRERGCEFLRGGGQLFQFLSVNRFEKFFPSRKVTIQSARSDARLFGDFVQAGIRARTSKRLPGNFEDALAIALRIGA